MQISELAIFGQCVGAIAWFPTFISLLVLLLHYGLGPIWRRRPVWLRNFAAEEPGEVAEAVFAELTPGPGRGEWALPTVVLLINMAVGLVVSILASLDPGMGPLFLMPLIPEVRNDPAGTAPPPHPVPRPSTDSVEAITFVLLAVDRPRSTPGPPLVLTIALLLAQLIMLSTVLYFTTGKGLVVWVLQVAITMVSTIIILNMPMRDPLLDDHDICSPSQTPNSKFRSPEDNFTLWNWMSADWMAPIVNTGRQRQLHDEDIWALPLEFQHDRLHRLFRDVKGSVRVRILKANAPDLVRTTCLGILESICSLLPVIFLKQLLSALEDQEPNRKVAVVYGVFILLVRLIGAQSGIFNLWFCRRAYERSRGEMITMIYEKTLMRKAFTFPSEHEEEDASEKNGRDKAAGPASMGKILNLMRNDV